jgi:hypothetical protein
MPYKRYHSVFNMLYIAVQEVIVILVIKWKNLALIRKVKKAGKMKNGMIRYKERTSSPTTYW